MEENMKKILTFCFVSFLLTSSFVLAEAPEYSQLDPKPYDPATEPNIDMYINSWKNSMPRNIHGSLVVRDILTACDTDPMHPVRKGAVLTEIKSVSFATLESHASTTPSKLEGEQELFYIRSGKGIITSGKKTAELYEGIGIVIAPGIEYSMKNTGDEPLTMYLICEPVPDGFTPVKDIVVKDNKAMPFGTLDGHWCYKEKDLLLNRDGLGILHAVITLEIDPMKIGHPHVHVKGCEEVWTTIRGSNVAWLGKEIRMQPPGTAYMIPPDGKTNHSNINPSKNEPLLMLYFSVRADIR